MHTSRHSEAGVSEMSVFSYTNALRQEIAKLRKENAELRKKSTELQYVMVKVIVPCADCDHPMILTKNVHFEPDEHEAWICQECGIKNLHIYPQ